MGLAVLVVNAGRNLSTYALPRVWRERWGLRRYGFHGLSQAWAARRAGGGRVVTCHLGAGASLAAVRDGRCLVAQRVR